VKAMAVTGAIGYAEEAPPFRLELLTAEMVHHGKVSAIVEQRPSDGECLKALHTQATSPAAASSKACAADTYRLQPMYLVLLRTSRWNSRSDCRYCLQL
jgi:hypothetical protein